MQLANLWDVSGAPTIVMTQRGARRDFQAALLDQGVEVVEFDFLTPEAVSYYCYDRGFLQVSIFHTESVLIMSSPGSYSSIFPESLSFHNLK